MQVVKNNRTICLLESKISEEDARHERYNLR